MTRPEQSGEDPHQPGAGSDGPSDGGRAAGFPEPGRQPDEHGDGPAGEPSPARAAGPGAKAAPEPGVPPDAGRSAVPNREPDAGPGGERRPGQPATPPGEPGPEPGVRSWEWAIDPAPPEGPDQEPVADPLAGRSVDAPDWSTPETPASTPPLSGYPHPVSWPAHTAGQGNPPNPPRERPRPGTVVPEFGQPGDRRWWFLLGIVAALLSCCCVAAGLIALAWGPELYGGLHGRDHRMVRLDEPPEAANPGPGCVRSGTATPVGDRSCGASPRTGA
ncbi:hypothetical protein [Micromonospora sp. HM5-17]|jgi:hypothetical protein|uniref:hypothetical protein n=1 Tax=Micromonospora sp. HM5-17 TaxID=2487710 RepID=UPI000F48FBDF|nr:hypothetical protein [Micromonospora sp. HM5-17]ROT33874.1 hypothetical protein EF879_02960 [Micromonospora sp. HM5-17]